MTIKLTSDNSLASIDCRSVGPGGTSVDFYRATLPDGQKVIAAVWTNEECPYNWNKEDPACEEHPYAATDGHNVSYLTREELVRMLSVIDN